MLPLAVSLVRPLRCGLWLSVVTLGCPSQIDDPSRTAPAPAPTPTPVVDPPRPPQAEPAPRPEPATRPVLAAFRRVLEAPPADATEVLAEPLVWSAPSSGAADRGREEVIGQLGAGSITVERILDLGATRAAFQVIGAEGPAALLVTIEQNTVTAVERFGAELLPAPAAARGPGVTSTAIAGGEPNVRNVALTRKLYAAANSREWAVLSDLVADDAPHVQGGADSAAGFERGLRTLLADDGARVNVRRHFAVREYVVVQLQLTVPDGTLHRPVAAVLDVLRVDHGHVVASWRYVNRRATPTARPAPG